MRVLVIDDEKNVADTLVLILEMSGWKAAAAYNAAAALQVVDSFQPGVVISDVIMPGMNGIEVCREIQARFPSCHIFLSSGQSATSELFSQAQKSGLKWELLPKPIEPEELIARLKPYQSRQPS